MGSLDFSASGTYGVPAAAPRGLFVRQACVEDAAALAQLHVRSWRQAYRGLLPDSDLDALSVPEFHSRWVDNLSVVPADDPLRRVFVVTSASQVLGWVAYGAARDEVVGPWVRENFVVAELHSIYVDPDAWGSGAGYALMVHALQHLRVLGFSNAYLWVLAGNRRAVNFYERNGWFATGLSKSACVRGSEVELLQFAIALGQ
ncbi:GNAT family N-acetyltransferase [Corynebacterium aquilae]|uniref:GNAT family N-acetyltransferase n=1 Tax=Corynebacterium aquilae TaxID=203263 RepID=UPI0009FE039C|nr:GNAT family N-acetyltransferase [Corynebacterium aquilae]